MDKTFHIDVVAEIEDPDGDFHTYETCLTVGAGWNPGYRQTLLDQGESRGYQPEWILLAATPEMAKHLGPYVSISVNVGGVVGYLELPGTYSAGDQIYTDEDGITDMVQDWLSNMEQSMADDADEARHEAIREKIA